MDCTACVSLVEFWVFCLFVVLFFGGGVFLAFGVGSLLLYWVFVSCLEKVQWARRERGAGRF